MSTKEHERVSGPRPYARAAGDDATAGPASVWHQGCLFTFLAEAADTGGQFSVMDILARRGLDPPAHTHTREDEAFLVLDGEVTFRCGGEEFDALPGTFVYLPRGMAHEFIVKTETARFLTIDVPGGGEEVFRRYSEPARELGLPPAPQGGHDEREVISMRSSRIEHGVVYDA